MILKELARSMTVASALALSAGSIVTIASVPSAEAAEATNRYFVIFDEPGALHYQDGQIRSPEDREGARFDSTRGDVIDYRAELAGIRQQHIDNLTAALGRSIEPAYEYDVVFHGIVINDLTGAEAARLLAQPGVKEVSIVKDYELSTDRVEAFVGAGAIWSGASTPSGTGARGAGQVIAIIDTGLNSAYATHPSFSNDASCGFNAGNPKVVAAKDCIGSSNCSGANPFSSANPHGSHVASTAAGNTHVATGGDLAGTSVSGVAPCAKLVTYKTCSTTNCDGAALSASFQTILNDAVPLGITAVNYSISGGNSPWTDSDRQFLEMVNAGIFVAASAGNTSDAIPNPIAQVAHRGPWVATVANSTHDRISSNPVSVAGGPQNVPAIKSQAPFAANVSGAIADAATLGDIEGCSAFPASSMTGRIALIRRGTCTFEIKGNNAIAAGAIGMVVFNNNAGPPIVMGGTAAHSIPSVMISQANGLAIQSFVGSNPSAVATMDATTVVALDPAAGDVLSTGSLRGPIPGGLEFTKPDITGPGTNIFAAYDAGANSYGFMSGTSMSGPHVAGAGALVRSVNPTWTPQEVKSALMLTAKKEGLKDFTNGTPNNGPWDADDVGNGRLDLTKAALSGLVLHETYANFLAAQGNQANQRALNIASMRNTNCTPSCTWTRTVRNTIVGTATSWSASGVNLPNLNVSVSPATFSFSGGAAETQLLTITAVPVGDQTAAVVFGEINLSETNDESPDLHMTVAVRGIGSTGTGDADLSLNLNAVPSSVANGSNVSFVANVGNFGPDPASGVTFELTLPAGVSYVSGGEPGNVEWSVGAGSIASDKFEASLSGAPTWSCSAAGQLVTCTLPGTLANASISPSVAVQAIALLANPGTVTATGEVSGDQFDPNPANNTASADVEVTGQGDVIFANGFEDPNALVCVDVTGVVGEGPAGNPGNTVILLNIGAGNEVTGVAADISVEAFDPSWLSEAQLRYGSTSLNQINLTPAGGTSPIQEPGVHDYTTGGILVLADLSLPNITVDADGILKLEFADTFNDASVSPDSEWSNLTPAATCPGLYLQCSDQAACNAAVSTYNNSL